jgi:hypothetical protein
VTEQLNFSLEFMLAECAGDYKNLDTYDQEIVANALMELNDLDRWRWISAFKIPVKKLWFSVDVELLPGTTLEDAIKAIKDKALKQFDGDQSGIVVWDAKFLNNVTADYLVNNNDTF